jgi:hypothetical protein
VLRPVGQVAPRRLAIRFRLPAGGTGPVRLRLAMLPGAWEIDEARLAVPVALPLPAWVAEPAGARLAPLADDVPLDPAGADTAVFPTTLHRGQGLTLLFDAPAPSAGLRRSAFLRLTGYYRPRASASLPDVHWGRALEGLLSPRPFADFALERLRTSRPQDAPDGAAAQPSGMW